jgi:hypothetical protein
MRSEVRAALLGLFGLAVLGDPLGAAEDPLEGDIRDLKVGTKVEDLPTRGYLHFACGSDGAEPGAEISGWTEFRHCPAEPSGLHEVAFQYDEDLQPWAEVNDNFEGTKVAGHPVILSLLIDDKGIAQGIRVVTDPDSRMYMKKKAFLLGIRVMGRYGRDGWQCVEAQPDDGKSPVGGMFIDRRCEKTFHDRHLILETDLYRTAEQHDQEFTGSTRLEIFKVAG